MAESEQSSEQQDAEAPATTGGGSAPKNPPKRQADAARRLAAKRAAKSAAKAAKRGTDLIPEGVGESVEQAASWYDDNAAKLWVGLGAGLALGLGAVIVSGEMEKSGAGSASALGDAIRTSVAPIIAEGEDKPEGVDESYATQAARNEKALAAFGDVLAKHGGSNAAGWAQLGEANALYNLGKYAEAQASYDKALQDAKDYVRWRALEGAGFALEAQKKYPEAQQRFQELGEMSGLEPLGQYHVARMLVAQGQKDKAVDTLDAMVKAERDRATADGKRFEGVLGDAESLLAELAVETGRDSLKADLRGSSMGAAPQPGGAGDNGQLSQEIVDALRKQLEQQGASEGGKGLTQEIVDALQQNVDEGATGGTTLKVPADKLPQAPAAPDPTPAPKAAPAPAKDAQ